MSDGLHWIDGAIIGLYACGMLAIGWYYRRRQTSTEEYFVGNRNMSPLLVGISLFATLFSTITYLSTPGEVISHGPAVLSGALAIPFAYYAVGYLLVPVYMRHRVTSAYELLELRLGAGARLCGATLFILLRLLWMGLLVFLASRALLVMIGLDDEWLPVVTFVTGSVAVGYSSLGGLRAVVITDFFQALLLFGGMLLVLAVVSFRLGGFGWIPTEWNTTWDTQPLFRLDPTVRVTVAGSVMHGLLWWVCTAGGDQTAVQRFMATRDAAAARRSFLVNSIAGALVSVALALVGFALLGYFQADPARLPPGRSIKSHADLLFPHFLSHHLPIGVSGLVVSGMFAAAMSSLDSGINSITAVIMTDFVDRFRGRPLDRRTHVRAAALLAAGIGLAVVTASSFMQYVPGNFLEMSQRTQGLVVVPIFVLFFVALFVPRATQAGALVGAAAALVTAISVAYWAPLTGRHAISFQWINPAALTAGTTAGWLVSVLSARPAD